MFIVNLWSNGMCLLGGESNADLESIQVSDTASNFASGARTINKSEEVLAEAESKDLRVIGSFSTVREKLFFFMDPLETSFLAESGDEVNPLSHIPDEDFEPTIDDDFEATDMEDLDEANEEEDFDSSRKAFSSKAAAAASEALRFLAATAEACNRATVEDLLEPLLVDLVRGRLGLTVAMVKVD